MRVYASQFSKVLILIGMNNCQYLKKIEIYFGCDDNGMREAYLLNEGWKPSFGDTFSHISVVLFSRLFPKPMGFTHGWACSIHANFMIFGSKLRSVSCVLIHEYILTLRIWDHGQRDHPRLPPLTPFWSRRCQNSRYFVPKYRDKT